MRVMQVHFWGDARQLTGSVEKVLRGFAELDAADIDLDIASVGIGIQERVSNANYLFFHESKLRNRVLNKWLGLKAFTFPSLVDLIEARRPEILHLHNRQNLADDLIQRLSYRPRILLHYHRHFDPYQVPKCADALIAVSESVRRDIIDKIHPVVPVAVIPNPVPITLQPADPVGDTSRNTLPRLLYGGGKQAHKGWFELISVLADPLLANRITITLCGPKLDQFRADFVARNLGMLDQKAFMAELRAADIVVMPSHNEGFPLLALETLAQGKILVATTAGGLGEILSRDNAFIHQVGDRDTLLAALNNAISLFELHAVSDLAKFRRSAIESVQPYSAITVGRKLADLYREFA